MSDERYTIEKLSYENIGIHRTFTLDASDCAVLEITGGGEVGKTTILDGVIAALTGKELADLVTQGEEEALLDTVIAGVRIKRRVKNGKTVGLEVYDDNGHKITKSPQGWLDTVFGGAILRPIELYQMDPKKRCAAVLRALKPDVGMVQDLIRTITSDTTWTISEPGEMFAVVKTAYDTAYATRKEANAKVKEIEDRVKVLRSGIPSGFNPDAPLPAAPSVGDLYRQRDEIKERFQLRNKLGLDRATLLQQIIQLQQQVDAISEEMNALPGNASDDSATLSHLDKQIELFNVEQEKYTQQIAAHQEVKFRCQEVAELEKKLPDLQGKASNLDYQVKRLNDLPKEILGKVDCPIPGMTLNGEDILIDGVPLDERGDSMKLIWCVKISMGLAPEKFKAVLVDGCERMDSTQRLAMVQEIVGNGFQAVMTRVTDGPLTIETCAKDDVIGRMDQATPSPSAESPTPAVSTGSLWDEM